MATALQTDELDLVVKLCGPVLGAEVRGVQVDDTVDPEIAGALRALLIRNKELFLRDLDLTCEQHLALGRVFGPLEGHPVIAHVPDYPEIPDIRGAEGRVADADINRRYRAVAKWHSDVTFRAGPSFGAVLRARELPAIGGDTLWCDAAAAYEGLSDEVTARIDGRTAARDLLQDFSDHIAPERSAPMAAEFPPQHHPIVPMHLESGERALFVNASFTSRIDDMNEAEGAILLRHLLGQSKTAEYQVRFR